MDKELKKEIGRRVEEIKEYAKEHTKKKFYKDGSFTEYIEYSPIAVNERFLKRLQPPSEGIYMYTSTQLEEFYEAYREIVLGLNEYIGVFPTSLSSYCKLIGITVDTLRGYKDTKDINMKRVIDRIYEEIGDDNLFIAQLGQASEKSTLFKLKSQNEMEEKRSPNVNISVKALVNNAKYDARLEKYKDLIETNAK